MSGAKTTMSKTTRMDKLIQSHVDEWDISNVNRVIKDVFGINLKEISKKGVGKQAHLYDLEVKQAVAKQLRIELDSDVLDQQLQQIEKIDLLALCLQQQEITGSSVRKAVNQIFGINLDGIASLEGAGISIYSKGQWIIRKDTDLTVVKTWEGDSRIEVYPASVYRSDPKLRPTIDRLHGSLTRLGFTYQKQQDVYEYSDPQGESVSDSFKMELFSTLKENTAQALEGGI